MLTKAIPHDVRVVKTAFKRACEMVGGNTEMARYLGMQKQAGQLSKWASLEYSDRIPSDILNQIDRACGYPVMKEAICGVDDFELRRITPDDPDMPICGLVAAVAGESGRAMQVTLEANADGQISRREAECIEGAARKAMQFFQHIIDAAHAAANPEVGR